MNNKIADNNSSINIFDLGEHIDYISSLIKNRIRDEAEKQSLNAMLGEIVEKNNDKLLNMSVIGEFSTGKSTFINSLLRTELLSSCAIQGTTVTNTIIEHGSCCSVDVIYKEQKRKDSNIYNSAAEMMERIKLLTTDSAMARKLLSVTITVPADNIKDNFRIIDTPGTNSLEAWHEQITKNAINHLSDISVILVDSSKPFPESFCNFVKSNLTDVLSRCVFVLTKIDIIKPKERNMMLSYAQKKIKNEFGIESPVVLPYCATAVLEDEQDSDLYKMSVESEEKLVSHMALQKQSAQMGKLIKLVNSLYVTLEGDMNELGIDCEMKIKKLEESKQIDLAPFIDAQKTKCSKYFLNNAEKGKNNTANKLAERRNICVNGILGKLDNFNTTGAIKQYVEEKMINECRQRAKYNETMCECLLDQIDLDYYNAIQKYEKEFTEHFKSLDLLAVDFDSIKSVAMNNEKGVSLRENAKTTTSYLQDQISKENVRTVGGAAAGAVLGTAIMPGVGTVVGGVLGALFGGFFGPSIDTVRTDTKNNLRPLLMEFFISVEDQLLDSVDEYIKEKNKNLFMVIEDYYNTYKDIINAKINEEKKRKGDLENQKKVIEKILFEISERKNILVSVNEQLRLSDA